MGDDQQFCLRWNNHQSTLIQNFDTLLESGTLVDCTLAAEGKYLKAHKVVLSACSPYFEGLLSEHYDKHPVFILKDVKFKELKAMMDYMYRGEVNISQDQLTALLKAAESLQIKGLSDNRTGGAGSATTGKADTRPAKTVSSTAVASSSSSVDIPHASSGLTIEKNSKVPRQSLQQVSVSDLPEDSASPQLRGLSSREGSQSPTRRRKRLRRRSLGNDDTNSMENHEASNSSDVNVAPALAVAPVADEKAHADPADSIGRSALMQQLTKPADEMLQIPIEKPEPSEEMIQPKSEYMDDQESVEDLTNLDDDMNDLNEMEQDNSRAGPSHDPSQHPGIASWHIAGDRSNASVVGAAVGPPGTQDEVFLAAHEAAQAQRDSQDPLIIAGDSEAMILVKQEILADSDNSGISETDFTHSFVTADEDKKISIKKEPTLSEMIMEEIIIEPEIIIKPEMDNEHGEDNDEAIIEDISWDKISDRIVVKQESNKPMLIESNRLYINELDECEQNILIENDVEENNATSSEKDEAQNVAKGKGKSIISKPKFKMIGSLIFEEIGSKKGSTKRKNKKDSIIGVDSKAVEKALQYPDDRQVKGRRRIYTEASTPLSTSKNRLKLRYQMSENLKYALQALNMGASYTTVSRACGISYQRLKRIKFLEEEYPALVNLRDSFEKDSD